MMKIPGRLVVFAAGGFLGVLLGVIDPAITRFALAWDAQPYFHFLCFLAAGALAALPSPRSYLWAPLGCYFGQVVYLSIMHLSGQMPAPLWLMGSVFGAVHSLFSLPGAFIVFLAWRRPSQKTER